MKGIILITGIIFSFGLQAQNIHFLKTYGNSGYDFGEDIKQTSDTGYIATGASSSFGTGTADAFLLKVDSMGVFQWSYSYGGSGSDWGEKVIITNDSGYAIAGYTNSSGAGGFDFYLIKTDSLGVPQWEKTYGGSDWDYGRSLTQLDDSGFILVGETYSYGSGNRDVYVIRTDKNGDTLWTKTYGGAADDYANDIILDGDSIVVVGGTESFGAGNADGLILKYNIDGTLGKERYIGQADRDYFTSIIAKDTFYLLGGARSFHHYGGCDCGEDFWLYKIVNNIDTVLADTTWFGEELGTDIVNDVAISPGNNTFYGGSTTSWGAPDISAGYSDAFIGKHLNNYYTVGDYVNNFGESYDDEINGLDYCFDNGVVGIGNMYFGSTGGYNLFIVRVDKTNSWGSSLDVLSDMESEIITLSIDEPDGQKSIKIYPTLVQDKINITGIDGNYTVRVFGLSGQQYLQQSMTGSELSLDELGSGLYLFEITTDQSRYAVKIVKE